MRTPRFGALTVCTFIVLGSSFAQTNTFPSSGPVGIGTTGPGAKLHVAADTSDGVLITTANSGPWALRIKDTGYSGGEFSFYQATTGWAGIFSNYPNGSCIQMGPEGTIALAPSSGNVGIGTNSPASRLHVAAGDISIDAGRGIRKGGNNWIVGYQAEWPGVVLGSGTPTDKVIINAGGSERLRIETNGNVGVGTSNPTARLQVGAWTKITDGTWANPVTPGSTSAGERVVLFGSAAWKTCIGMGDENSIWFQAHTPQGYPAFRWFTGAASTAPEERMRLMQNGNLGIGTNNPTHALTVNGAVRAKEVIVDTGWSDYVFADGYRLAPLSEVERHIKTERHLPGIPSAAEVGKDGVSVGEMQAKLLAKIEELTLHQIAQEKRTLAIETENAALRTEVEALKKAAAIH